MVVRPTSSALQWGRATERQELRGGLEGTGSWPCSRGGCAPFPLSCRRGSAPPGVALSCTDPRTTEGEGEGSLGSPRLGGALPA